MRTLLLTLAIAAAASAVEPPEFQKREFPVPGGEPLKYVVYVPKNLNAAKPIPLLVFLHGSCEVCVTHERILKESNLRFWHGYDENVQREPTILMAPAGGRGGWTSPERQVAVLGILDALLEELPVDRKRIYLQGFSMGGGGTWHYLQQRPGFFAAANPQALSARSLDPELVKNTPIWATIGSEDSRVEAMTANVAAIRAANGDPSGGLTEVTGVNPRFTIFPNTNHGGAQAGTQDIPGFADWMYLQVNDGNAPPNVRFIEPPLGAKVKRGPIAVRLDIRDPEGRVALVELYRGDDKVGEDAEAPYEYVFKGLPAGSQTLRAKAIDAGGKSRTAELVVEIEP